MSAAAEGLTVENEPDRRVDWALLNKIHNENFRLKLSSFWAFFYDMVQEFVTVQTELENCKTQMKQKINSVKCEECSELKKRITVQDNMLTSLGSSIVKVNETRRLDSHISEVFKILSGDTIMPTPPPEADTSPKTTVKSQEKPPLYANRVSQNSKTPSKFEAFDESKQIKKRKSTEVGPVAAKGLITDCSDVSVTDDSVTEIHGTPAGQTSPILGMRVRSRKQAGLDQRSYSKCKSPKRKLLKLYARGAGGGGVGGGGGGRLRQTCLRLEEPTRRVDLSGAGRSGNERTLQKLDFVRTSTEEEDVIQPSPTSETVRHSFSTMSRTARPPPATPPRAPRPPPATPPRAPPRAALTSQDDTRVFACDVDFDGPLETEISFDTSPNVLEGYREREIKTEPDSPVLRENRNADNVRPGAEHDTNVSVSVLRPPLYRAPAHRDHAAPPVDSERKPKRVSPRKRRSPAAGAGAAAGDATVCAEASSLAGERRPTDPRRTREKRCDREQPAFVYKEDVVRKRADKRQLPGWSCEDCENYYGVAYADDPATLRKMMERCSRHRGRFDPARAATPPGFWDLHLSVPDDTRQLNLMNGVE